MTKEAIVARYQIGPSLLILGGLSVLSMLLGAAVIWPTDFALQRPIFSLLVPVTFLLSLVFVWKFFDFLWAMISRRGAAVYFERGRLVTISGSMDLNQIAHAEAKAGRGDGRYVEIALKSGRQSWFGVGLLDTDADTIVDRIRAGTSLNQTAQS